jgi:hypothetical protein
MFPSNGSNNGYSSASGLNSSPHRLPYLPSPLLITSRHGPHRKQLFYCCLWISCLRDMLIAPLSSNGRGLDHRKHRSSACCTVVAFYLLLQERVYRAVVQKRPWYMRPSQGRCIATALHATILNNVLENIWMEAVVTLFKVIIRHFQEGLRKIFIRIQNLGGPKSSSFQLNIKLQAILASKDHQRVWQEQDACHRNCWSWVFPHFLYERQNLSPLLLPKQSRGVLRSQNSR